MINIIEFDISDIPELLVYFVPGYIAVALYRRMTESNKNNEHTIWISCVISYVLLLITNFVLPESADENTELIALCSCGFAIGGSIIWVKLIKSECVYNFLRSVFYFSPTSTVIESCIKLKYPGSMARVYLKDEDYYVEGTIFSYRNDPEDPYIALRYYKFFQEDEEEPYYTCEDEKQYFIVDLNNAQQIEIWETIPASEQ